MHKLIRESLCSLVPILCVCMYVCVCVCVCVYVIEVGREKCSSLRKMVNSKCFWPFESFFQKRLNSFFGQVTECPILQLHEIRVSHVIACPDMFILLCNRCRQGKMLRLMKNDHFYKFSTVWVLSPQVFLAG